MLYLLKRGQIFLSEDLSPWYWPKYLNKRGQFDLPESYAPQIPE